jgi:predicted nucleotide-binding protein (sugar kinase/HSP70/actin superfamily)
VRKGKSLPDIKYKLLFDRPMQPENAPRAVIGIPRVLNLYENFPFWCTLLVESGFAVHLSAPSRVGMYEKGAGTITSENICFPAKLVHGHIFDLIEAGVDRIFYPMVMDENPEFQDANGCYNCPVVYGYPELINSAVDPAGRFAIPLDKPAVAIGDLALLRAACEDYLLSLGVEKRVIQRAFQRAVQAQRLYKAQVRQAGAEIINQARAEQRPLVLMLTRPYHIDPQIHHKAPDILTDFGVDVLTEDAIPLPEGARLENKHVVSLWQFSNRYLYAARWACQQPDVEVVQINSFGCGPDAIAVDEARRILDEWGKGHTVVRVDEIESTGSMRLRLRSMIEAMQRRKEISSSQLQISATAFAAQSSFTRRRETRLFQKEDRSRTIIVPDFSRFTTLPIVRPLADMGYNLEVLPSSDRQSVEIGLKYVNNEICYPAIVLIGDVIKALQSGKYDLHSVATGLNQTGGMCRETCYLTLLKNALVSAGFDQVPVISVSTNGYPLNEQPGFTISYPKLLQKILLTITYADTISTMYHACAVREVNPGSAQQLADQYMDVLNDRSLALTANNMQSLLYQAVKRFNALPVNEGSYPVVGVVGEIYVRYNTFGGGGVVPWLMQQGIEVVPPPLANFFTASIISWNVRLKHHLSRPGLSWLLARLLDRPVNNYIQSIDRIMQGFRFYRPTHYISHVAEKASQVLSLVNQYGEGWLIPGEIGSLVESNVKNILCLQPFGCLPNHIVAKGIQTRLKAQYPDMNLLFLDCDAGTSEVNFFNRMHFFAHHAREYRK